MGRPKTTEKSFWDKVERTEDANACWLWRQALSECGFGKARLNYKCIPAHRLAYFYTHGEFPPGILTLKCGNNACCNPAHFELGPTDEERFWSFVDKNGPFPDPTKYTSLKTQCWIWTGAKRKLGHGHFSADGKQISAHRFSYLIHFGPIPEGSGVLHKCDIGSCVRPDHLFTGNQSANMLDAAGKMRTTIGEANAHAVLNNAQVIEMRKLHSEGISYSELSKRFGIAKSTVSPIILRKTWTHL